MIELEKIEHSISAREEYLHRDDIVNHIENEKIDFNIVEYCLLNSRNADFVSDIVISLSFRRQSTEAVLKRIKDIAYGEIWDDQDISRLQTILSLHRFFEYPAEIKPILLRAIKSRNPVIRDAAVVVAQQYLNIHPAEIKWGNGSGDLIDVVDPAIRRWLA